MEYPAAKRGLVPSASRDSVKTAYYVETQNVSNNVRIAFFGNGFARKVMLPCLQHVEGIEVVGMASPNLSRVEETAREFNIEHVSSDHGEVLERAQPDLVFIVTPPHRHLDQAKDALESGAHVVCEKPTALSAEESEKMLCLSKEHPSQLALLDHELRFDPKRLTIEKWIREGRLGKIYHASYAIDTPGRMDPTSPWTWWSDRSQGGGMLGALGSHAVDALRVFLGEVASVRGTLATAVTERKDPRDGQFKLVTADDFASAVLRMRSGSIVNLRVSGMGGERRHEFRITGDQGSVHFSEQGPLRASFAPGEPMEVQSVPEDLPSNRSIGIPDSDWARNFLRYSREIVAAIRENRTSVPGAATFADGHETQKVLDAICASDGSSQWTAVDADA